MTAIKLLEKLGADTLFDPTLLSKEDKVSIADIMRDAEIFNAIEVITLPDEEETEEETENEPEEEKRMPL